VPAWQRWRTRQSAAALAAVALAATGVVLGVRATSGASGQLGPASILASGSTSDPRAPDTQPLGRACNQEGMIADISGAAPASPGQGRVRMSFEAGFKVGTLWSAWWRWGWVTEDVTTSQAYDGRQSLRVRVTGPFTAIGTNHIAGLMPGGRVTVHIWYGGQGAGYICPFAEDKASSDDWIPQKPLRLSPSDRRGWYTYSWPMATNFLPLGTGFQLNKTSRSDFVILLDAVTW
jgi:hypothetical protein